MYLVLGLGIQAIYMCVYTYTCVGVCPDMQQRMEIDMKMHSSGIAFRDGVVQTMYYIILHRFRNYYAQTEKIVLLYVGGDSTTIV